MDKVYYDVLRNIDVSKWVEKKPRLNKKTGKTVYLNFLSWANAWDQLKQRHPDATYTVYENMNGWNYHTDGRTAWVKVGVTVEGIEHIEMLPVYDFNFNAIPLDALTSDHVNTAIQRALTKAIARHGLGLSLYAGEDIKSEDDDVPFYFSDRPRTHTNMDDDPANEPLYTCQDCGVEITEAENGFSRRKYGRPLCRICQKNA